MKKSFVCILVLAMLGTLLPAVGFPTAVKADTYSVEQWRSQEIPFTSTFGSTLQYLSGTTGTFEDGTVNGWTAFSGGTVSASTTVKHGGSYSLKLAGRSYSWTSPTYNIYTILKAGGPGTYNISMWVYVDALSGSTSDGRMIIRGDSANQYSFFSSGQSWGQVSGIAETAVNTWVQYKGSVTVTSTDISSATGNFSLMIDALEAYSGQNLYIDDVTISVHPITQYMSGTMGTYDDGTLNGWTAFNGGTLSASTTVKHSGSYSCKMGNRPYSWSSAQYNIYSLIKAGGAGTYYISMWVYADALPSSPKNGRILIRSDYAGQYSFLGSGISYGYLSGTISTSVNTWTLYTGSLTVTEADIGGATGNFSLMIDTLDATSGQNLYIDDVSVTGYPTIQYLTGANTGANGTFEGGVTTGWSAFSGGTLSASTTVKHSGSYSVKLANRPYSWSSPACNIYSLIKNGGAGTYRVSMWVYADALPSSPKTGKICIRGDSVNQYSFFIAGQSFAQISDSISTAVNSWTKYYGSFTVTEADISGSTGNFSLMIDSLDATAGQNLYIDDVQVYKTYSDPFKDINLNVTFTGPNSTTLVMPAFWDGATTWKVRFAPTLTGTWNYTTSCSNTSDTGLHNQTGTINCTSYTGDLEIYEKGFAKVTSGNRYFTYADGTAFQYVGDTHWTFVSEPYATMFQPLVDQRVDEGFTVYQSEPNLATYDLSNGLTGTDLAGFADFDRRFQYIADAGLVHANAQLFFTSELADKAAMYPTEYLQRLSRYWVARYASYPVMWTTAQEVDATFYNNFDASTNPWKIVFAATNKYDPYVHPQTAHQEGTDWTRCSDSGFKNLTGYSWFSPQWAPAKNAVLDFDVPKDYYNNGGTRPTVLYEGEYENLTTNGFGIRVQGWTANLNGMFGASYGVQDIWYYNTSMYEESGSTSYGITITAADRQVLWTTSRNFSTGTELGTYMKGFFSTMNWWQLTPRFDDTAYFSNNGSYYSISSILNDSYVAYFYNATTNTGTLKGMDNVAHTAKWYNPRSGAYTTIGTNIVPSGGQWTIPAKPDNSDWVLYVYHT